MFQNMHSNLDTVEVIEEAVSRFSVKLAEESSKVALIHKSHKEMDEVLQNRHAFYATTMINTFSYIEIYFSRLFSNQPMNV